MSLQWDLFCRVVDNFGDVGVCWRLAHDLAARGEKLRLWIDDPSALQWMAPHPRPASIEIRHWDAPAAGLAPPDVVIEAFGCELPKAFVAQMAVQARPPLWLNLEYLSAESYVERSHGLSSPQFSGPGRGLTKRFFYPGFTSRTGGLLREPDLLKSQAEFDAAAWLSSHGVHRRAGQTVVSLFTYANMALPALLSELAQADVLLLVCAGKVQDQMTRMTLPADLNWLALPFLSQPNFDRLLWACDLNFVRGEDSFVRAQWAGKPFVWHIYPQDDLAHAPKLEAFMARWLADADATLANHYRTLWRQWNGLQPWATPSLNLPELLRLGPAHAQAWRAHLAEQDDLTSQLIHLARKTS
ncbi:elongation factor P maturation arginine rhamnosyltransferase EarP [Roseateles koreensis]|uniref:Protein-arginine rhamnosyltransferase n=1 Tax=Roseateles koreensis TaxID=2987526 RepID=A0ABT5KNA4_9BURK|nr:elongation factor P maturation arginine rhamnosyltransferase EarP [Roseateles koreensis]MDC8783848.1 elongation factor P maturation arginine rhamnosyltransferase EarP [Roseateles koreensis]